MRYPYSINPGSAENESILELTLYDVGSPSWVGHTIKVIILKAITLCWYQDPYYASDGFEYWLSENPQYTARWEWPEHLEGKPRKGAAVYRGVFKHYPYNINPESELNFLILYGSLYNKWSSRGVLHRITRLPCKILTLGFYKDRYYGKTGLEDWLDENPQFKWLWEWPDDEPHESGHGYSLRYPMRIFPESYINFKVLWGTLYDRLSPPWIAHKIKVGVCKLFTLGAYADPYYTEEGFKRWLQENPWRSENFKWPVKGKPHEKFEPSERKMEEKAFRDHLNWKAARDRAYNLGKPIPDFYQSCSEPCSHT